MGDATRSRKNRPEVRSRFRLAPFSTGTCVSDTQAPALPRGRRSGAAVRRDLRQLVREGLDSPLQLPEERPALLAPDLRAFNSGFKLNPPAPILPPLARLILGFHKIPTPFPPSETKNRLMYTHPVTFAVRGADSPGDCG